MKEWLPEEIKAFRERLTLYQREFANMLGVTTEHVNRLEKGGKIPSRTLKLLLDCLERQSNEKKEK